MQANLTRLSDLTAEIRRQLKPLGRQAEVARRAQVVQADLRDAKARLLADDLVQLVTTLDKEVADEAALRARRAEVEEQLATARHRLAELEDAAAAASPQHARAQETWYRLSSLRERVRGTASLAADRRRLLADMIERAPERPSGRDPEELAAQARAVREQEAALAEAVATARETLADAVDARHEAEQAEGEEERRISALLRAAADRREGLARLAGQVAARRSRVEAGQEQVDRLHGQIADAEQRAAAAQARAGRARGATSRATSPPARTSTPSTRPPRRSWPTGTPSSRTPSPRSAPPSRSGPPGRPAVRRSSSASSARTARARCSPRATGCRACSARSPRCSRSSPATRTRSPPRSALAADAVAVESPAAALDALRLLKAEDAGQAGALVAGSPSADRCSPIRPARRRRPGARWARALVQAPAALGADAGPPARRCRRRPGPRRGRRPRRHPAGR